MTDLATWVRLRETKQRAVEAEERQKFFEAYDGARGIPDLEFPPPTCPACSGELEYDREWWCMGCCIGWDHRGSHGSFDSETAAEDPDHPKTITKEDTHD